MSAGISKDEFMSIWNNCKEELRKMLTEDQSASTSNDVEHSQPRRASVSSQEPRPQQDSTQDAKRTPNQRKSAPVARAEASPEDTGVIELDSESLGSDTEDDEDDHDNSFFSGLFVGLGFNRGSQNYYNLAYERAGISKALEDLQRYKTMALPNPVMDGESTTNEADSNDITLAHQFRLSLKTKPSQSSFRVLAMLFYETEGCQSSSTLAPWVAQTTSDGRTFILGSNDEPGFMGGAICAERSALVQLRFVPNAKVTTLVISTDSSDPISPGLLCREFLAGHSIVPWDLRVISVGNCCSRCKLRDDNLLQSKCQNGTEHVYPLLRTTIRELYPHPSPFTRLSATESVEVGRAFQVGKELIPQSASLHKDALKLLEMATAVALANESDLHPIYFGAAVLFEDGRIETSRQVCALEYGCTLDAVSQLAPHFLGSSASPVLLVQADQYGVAHAPFAPARSFLTEKKFGDCHVIVHDIPGSDDKVGCHDFSQWRLHEISVADLAPNPPSWKEGL
eukprot:Nitzschia sp. Nitz4//scaffold137_size62074//6852//8719//NITZ4_006406-RA/size62074-augustus-gene-0.4-mRNA-1//-1//CDS//3329535673//6953//frame0